MDSLCIISLFCECLDSVETANNSIYCQIIRISFMLHNFTLTCEYDSAPGLSIYFRYTVVIATILL